MIPGAASHIVAVTTGAAQFTSYAAICNSDEFKEHKGLS